MTQTQKIEIDRVEKRIGELRSLVSIMLIVTAVAAGLGSFWGVSYTERASAVNRFDSTVSAAVSTLDGNFGKLDNGLRLMAQSYVALHPDLSDWPTAMMPNFQTSSMLAKKIGESDSMGLVVRVKPEDVSRYEAFALNYWDNDDPAIAPGSAGIYSLSPFRRGLYAVNDTGLIRDSFLSLHHETTGATTWGEGKHIFALAQLLYSDIQDTPGPLGYNMYSTEIEGEAIDILVKCVDESSFSNATLECGVTSKMTGVSDSGDFLTTTDYALSSVTSFRSVPIVVENAGGHEQVGIIGAQYSWGPTLSRIFADDVSGIDIVVKYRGFTLTLRMKNGHAEMIGGSSLAGYGDVASKRYQQHKRFVANALSSRQFAIETDEQYNLEMTFYPTETFIAEFTTFLPILVACSAVALILLVSAFFVGYDVAVRGQAARKEIVLDTKRRFVRFVSHEIRTPMNAVRLGMTLFTSEIDGLGAKLAGLSLEDVHTMLQGILMDWRQIAMDVQENTETAVDVLNDLLNYDKIESGSMRLEFSMVPVWKVLQRTFATFVLQAREKGIVFQLQGDMFDADATLQLVGDLGSLCCVGDDTRIAQVLRNLISNSLKFTGARGTVILRAEYIPDGLPRAVIPQAPRLLLSAPRAGAVLITVEDDGAGLSPTQVLDICKEGVQFNANTLQAGGGSGLGLFIGKGIVEQHGGTMRVFSEGLGKGATFVIELPVSRVEEHGSEPPSVRSISPKTSDKVEMGAGAGGIVDFLVDENTFRTPPDPVTRYVLLVDDAVSNRKLLSRILKGKGYVCREAADGQLALDVYNQMCADGTPPCAVLMDCEMPVMNGPTATKQLREMGCECFIVGVTGNVMHADIDNFMQHGADAVLAKPLRIEIFESMMESYESNSSRKTYQSPHPAILPAIRTSSFGGTSPAIKPSARSGAKVYADDFDNTQNV